MNQHVGKLEWAGHVHIRPTGRMRDAKLVVISPGRNAMNAMRNWPQLRCAGRGRQKPRGRAVFGRPPLCRGIARAARTARFRLNSALSRPDRPFSTRAKTTQINATRRAPRWHPLPLHGSRRWVHHINRRARQGDPSNRRLAPRLATPTHPHPSLIIAGAVIQATAYVGAAAKPQARKTIRPLTRNNARRQLSRLIVGRRRNWRHGMQRKLARRGCPSWQAA